MCRGMGLLFALFSAVGIFGAFSQGSNGPNVVSLAGSAITLLLGLLLYKASEIEERLRELVKLSGGAEPVAQAEKSLPAGIEWRALGRAFAGKKAPAPPAPKLVMRPIPPPAPPPLR